MKADPEGPVIGLGWVLLADQEERALRESRSLCALVQTTGHSQQEDLEGVRGINVVRQEVNGLVGRVVERFPKPLLQKGSSGCFGGAALSRLPSR